MLNYNEFRSKMINDVEAMIMNGKPVWNHSEITQWIQAQYQRYVAREQRKQRAHTVPIKRKTVSVEWIKQKVNHCNANSTCSKETREGYNSLLELILHETGNYKGFTYIGDFKVDDTRRHYA